MCIFEYDEKREKELIRKAEYAEGKKEGLKEGQKQGEERVFGIYRLYRDKYTENQIAEQMKIDVFRKSLRNRCGGWLYIRRSAYIHIVFTYRALVAAVCEWSGMCMAKMEFVFYG